MGQANIPTEKVIDSKVPVAPEIEVPTVTLPKPESACYNGPNRCISAEDEQSNVVWTHMQVIHGGQTHVKVPVAVIARYEGLDLAYQAKAFDCELDSWLSRTIDMGMIGSGLGQVHVLYFDKDIGNVSPPPICVERLTLMGMGMPGQFSHDDARYLMSNAIVAVKCMGFDECSISLFGIRRNEMSIERAVQACLLGILDAYERCRAIADSVKSNSDFFRELANRPLKISVVEPKKSLAKKILKTLTEFSHNSVLPNLQLEIDPSISHVPRDVLPETTAVDTDPIVPITYLRITRTGDIESRVPELTANASLKPRLEVFQFSALSNVAAMTVRDAEVNSYFVRHLPSRLVTEDSPKEREALGMFLTNYLIPEDFHQVIECAENLTLVVDKSTAEIPWEMAVTKSMHQRGALATNVCVSRRFHSTMSPPPGSPPPINNTLNVLIIADPAPSPKLELPAAQKEAFAIIEILQRAGRVWRDNFDIRVTLRIGSKKRSPDLEARLKQLSLNSGLKCNAEYCDPLNIAFLIINEQFDVIHYAGHGEYDESTGRAGWLLDDDCFLTAHEIFRVRQVPRLVFANACFSAVTASAKDSRSQLVGLAQAFFARGIPNYIGTGWRVDDKCACECARWFYARLLGMRDPNEEIATGTAPPATIGDALLSARKAVQKLNPTMSSWGAYQHYGRISDKLLPFTNSSESIE